MVIYDFKCEQGHGFEGWFGNAEECQDQLSRDLIACPLCATTKVHKELAAPAVHLGRAPRKLPPKTLVQDEEGQRTTLFRAYVDAVREVIDRECENVGERFADEAIAMHDGEVESRNIVGTTTKEEEDTLRESGVPFQKVFLPRFDD